jgi:adenylate kinase family enzyme
MGKTGSGKTTLAQIILARRQYVVVYDAKGLLRWPNYARFERLDQCVKAAMDQKIAKIIYAPTHDELLNFNIINQFFQWIYIRRNTTCYVDEVYSVTKRGEIPSFYHALLTRGREYNISTISSTQRPKQIPQVVLSESEHYYVFQLMLPQDRQRVREIIPVTDRQLMDLKDHRFLYSNASGDTIGPLRLEIR